MNPNNDIPPRGSTGPWSGRAPEERPYIGHRTDPPYQSPPGWQPLPPLPPLPPSVSAKRSLKQTVRRIIPAILILFLVENIAAYGIAFGINMILSDRIQLADAGMLQFPAGTYYGMRLGLYDLLTSYLPVVIGEVAAVFYLRTISGIPFGRLFSRPHIPPSDINPAGRSLPAWSWILFAAVAGLGISMIGQILATVELNFLYNIDFPYYSPDFSTDGYTLLDTGLCDLYVCSLGPVMEEILFRGFLLKSCQRHGVSFAAVFTAILFTFYHMNLVQLCVPLLMGLFFAELTIRTDSLIPSLVCHIINNSFATLLDYITPSSEVWSWVFMIVECAVFIGIFAIFRIYYGKGLSAVRRWRSPVLQLSSQIGAAFATWPMVLYTVLYIGMIAVSSISTMLAG